MSHIKNHLDLLGKKVEDRVSGLKGVVTSVCFDLYGCIQAIVHPGLGADGKLNEQNWFDVSRLSVLDDKPVMQRPNWEVGPQAEGKQGAADKPKPQRF